MSLISYRILLAHKLMAARQHHNLLHKQHKKHGMMSIYETQGSPSPTLLCSSDVHSAGDPPTLQNTSDLICCKPPIRVLVGCLWGVSWGLMGRPFLNPWGCLWLLIHETLWVLMDLVTGLFLKMDTNSLRELISFQTLSGMEPSSKIHNELKWELHMNPPICLDRVDIAPLKLNLQWKGFSQNPPKKCWL